MYSKGSYTVAKPVSAYGVTNNTTYSLGEAWDGFIVTKACTGTVTITLIDGYDEQTIDTVTTPAGKATMVPFVQPQPGVYNIGLCKITNSVGADNVNIIIYQ
jgi:hypothetical protein